MSQEGDLLARVAYLKRARQRVDVHLAEAWPTYLIEIPDLHN
jgi:hypothetical protein